MLNDLAGTLNEKNEKSDEKTTLLNDLTAMLKGKLNLQWAKFDLQRVKHAKQSFLLKIHTISLVCIPNKIPYEPANCLTTTRKTH